MDIYSARSAMLINPEMWKGNSWLYEVVKVVTASEPIFFPGENWVKIYDNIHNMGSATANMAARIRTFAPEDSPMIDPARISQLFPLIRLAATMSFCKVKSKDFKNVRFYKKDAFLPQGAEIEVTENNTFPELILTAMKMYGSKIGTQIFDIIIEDTRVWFQTVLTPISNLRTKAVSRVLKNYGQVLGDDIIYWLAYRRIFSCDMDCVKNIAIEVNAKIKELTQADPEGYMADIIIEEKFCAEVYAKLEEWLSFWIAEYNKSILENSNGKIILDNSTSV